MVFWGVEVKPGEPYWHKEKIGQYEGSRLHLSQATLGLDAAGNGKERTVVKCKVGGGTELLLCSLTPGVSESCSLDLLFDQDVEFSVAGPTSVHLLGYFMPLEDEGEDEDDEDYSLDSEDSEFDDDLEVEDDFEDDECDEEAPILIELDDGTSSRSQVFQIGNFPSGPKAIELGRDNSKEVTKAGAKERHRQLLKAAEESEDEDGFPLPSKKRKAANGSDAPVESEAGAKKTKAEKVKEKKKKKKDKVKPLSEAGNGESTPEKPLVEKSVEPAGNGAGVTGVKDKQSKKSKPAIRKFPNGLEVEEIAMGKPDARQTKRGKRVSVYYTGKLKSNGKVFDSNVGRKPFTFRLGVGEVIKGWDVGVEGMRVGDKRRVLIPPAMGYGAKGAGKTIPGNAWLEFTVELVDVAK